MARSYKTWDTTSDIGYVPGYTYRSTPQESAYYKPYTSSSYPSYYRSCRGLEDSGNHLYTYVGPSGSRYDFVTGRHSHDNYRHRCLRDAEEPANYKDKTDLYRTSHKLQRNYRDVLDRFDGVSGIVTVGYLRASRLVQYLWEDLQNTKTP